MQQLNCVGEPAAKRGRKVNRVAGGFLYLLLATSVVMAQGPTGTILGTVKDSSEAVVPNATVTAQNRDTGLRRVISTNADGSYRLAALPVGPYEIRVEQQGFQTEVRGPVTLTVGQEAVLNFSLQVGAVEQTVSVTAEAPLVETTSGSLSSLISGERVANLPLNGRNYINLTLLQLGVTQSKNMGRSSSSTGTWFSTNGAPLRSNSYTLDGTILTDVTGASTASVSGNTLGLEGIREWRMITSSFSAEYGMTMGSQMVMVSKGGTNNFHGSLFEYLRNSALDARNFFDRITPATPRRLPAFARNNFGGSLGGPIRQDKAFFFATYEALRERLGVTSLLNTIPASARVDGGAGGVAQIASVVKPLLTLYPLPNVGTNQYTYPFTQPTNDNFGQARVDLTFSEKDQLFVRGTVDHGTETDTRGFGPPFNLLREGRVQYYTLSETHMFSPTLLNTARFSFSRTNKKTASPSGISGPQYSFVPGLEIGNISIGGVSGQGGDSTSPTNLKQNLFSWGDDMIYSKGEHSLKFGALINRYQQYTILFTTGRGSISFPSLTRFLLAQPNNIISITPGSVVDRTYHFNTLGFYAQDDWRVTSRLTLNLGLRYEFITEYKEVTGRASALRDIQHDAAFTLGRLFKNPSRKNFSPRFGFAWDVRGDGKTAVRGGFGLLYDLATYGNSLWLASVGTPPFSSRSSLSLNPPATFTLPFSFPPEALGRSGRIVDYLMQQPHLLQYNLALERQLPASMALTLAYVGTRGLNLMQTKEGNPRVPEIQSDGRQFFPVGAPRTNPNWETFELKTGAGNSWYNALQIGLNKRLSHGIQFQSSYTWSKCLDENQGQLAGGENTADFIMSQDPVRRSANRGVCNFDVTQNWRVNSLYRLPQVSSPGGVAGKLLNDWWVGAIFTTQSGLPFTPNLNTNRSRSGVNGGSGGVDRPDLVAGRTWKNIVSGSSSGCLGVPAGTKLGGPELYYDPCAFAIPAAGYFGTAGRTILRGPGEITLDFTLAKDTPLGFLGETGKLEFRAEFFNILNRVNFAMPNQTVFAGTADVQAPQATTARITETAPSRQIQLALKLLF